MAPSINIHDIEAAVVSNGNAKSKFSLLFWGVISMGASASLIFMNKYLMTEDRFPYAVPLVTLHQGAITLFSIILYTFVPRIYSTMDIAKQNPWLSFKLLFPLAVCCAGAFVLSNIAYEYVSVALLQIMKEGNVVGVFILCLCTGLSVWNWKVAVVLLGIMVCAVAAVSGDLHFVWFGIFVQVSSQLFECTKSIFMQFAMSDRPGAAMPKLDPLTAVGLTAPLVFSLLAVACAVSWDPAWVPRFFQWKWALLANCVVAFGLNLSSFKLIQVSTAMHLVLFGVAKGIFIVAGSSFIFAEPLTVFQYSCFAVILFLIYVHSNMAFHREAFDEGWGPGLHATFHFQSKGSVEDDFKERRPLLKQ